MENTQVHQVFLEGYEKGLPSLYRECHQESNHGFFITIGLEPSAEPATPAIHAGLPNECEIKNGGKTYTEAITSKIPPPEMLPAPFIG